MCLSRTVAKSVFSCLFQSISNTCTKKRGQLLSSTFPRYRQTPTILNE